MEKNYQPYPVKKLFEITSLYTLHYLELNKDFYEEAEAHDFWELVYADVGKLYLETDEETLYLREGDIYIHKPNQGHRFYGDKINASKVFIISFECNAAEMTFFVNRLFRANDYEQRLIGTIIYTAKETFEKTENHPEMTELTLSARPSKTGVQIIANIGELILLSIFSDKKPRLARPYLSKQLLEDSVVGSVIAILENNLCNSIKIKEIAAEANYSPSFLSSYFKKKTGYTVSEYHNILKIEYAKKLLRETNKNIDQISRELSFCSQQYFSEIFKKHTKMAPTEYKKSVLALS